MKLGMNLTAPVYWSDDFPFLDRMKCAGDWLDPIAGSDANGWPTAIGKQARCQIPMSATPTSFTARWKGKGTFKLTTMTNVVRGDGWMTFDAALASPDEKSSNQVVISAIDAADPLRDLSIVETRHDEAHQAGAIFDPAYLDRLRGFGQIRFMDWLRTNGSTRRTIADMPTMAQRSWFRGVPVEACLALARAIGARAWINLPEMADDALIRDIAGRCAPDDDIEFTNEMWNEGASFPQGRRAASAAKAAGMDKATWIAREQARVARVVASVGRKLVVGYQPTTSSKGWDRFAAALIDGGATSANVSRVMTTVYPTGGLNSIKALTPFMQANDRAGVIAALLADVEGSAGARFAVARALGDRLGVPWSVYEGNVAHLNTSNGYDTCVPFVEAVQRDPAIRAVGERVLSIAATERCDVLNLFDLSSPATRHGFFGVAGTPFGDLLNERRLASAPAPSTLEERVAALERRLAMIEADR